jgi:predicted esterase
MADDRLQSAIRLVHSGETIEARRELERIIKADPCDVPAWFWYAETWSSIEQRIRILEACLRINPSNTRVQQALASLTSHRKNILPSQTDIVSKQTAARNPSIVARPVQPVDNAPQQKPGPVPPAGEAQASSQQNPAAQNIPKRNRASMWFLAGSAIVLLVSCVTIGLMAYNSRPADPAAHRHDSPVEYYLYVPKNYSSDRAWPLFVGIHGSGGSGLDCWNWWQSFADKEGFILLCPSIADSGGGWYQSDGETKVFSAINQVRADYNVAPREFLAGFSAGAQFVQGFTFTNPQYVSGVSIISAGNYYRPNLNAKGIPFLVVIGDQDDSLAIEGSQGLAGMLSQYGFDVEYEILPGVGHVLTDKGRELTIALFRKANGK